MKKPYKSPELKIKELKLIVIKMAELYIESQGIIREVFKIYGRPKKKGIIDKRIYIVKRLVKLIKRTY